MLIRNHSGKKDKYMHEVPWTIAIESKNAVVILLS